MAGFFGKNEYAIIAASVLVRKLVKLRCRECSIWHMVFNSSLTVSITERLRSSILSFSSTRVFFMLFLMPVTRWMPSTKRISVSCLDMYPLSA